MRNNIRLVLSATCALVPLAIAQAAPEARAAEAEMTAANAADQSGTEDIVVTGTSIRGVDPVGSTVIALGRADLESSGAVTVADFMLNVPQLQQIGVGPSNRGAQTGNSNRSYASSLNLRGLNPGWTLTLFNGHRIAGQGSFGLVQDPSLMPSIAVERIEVVADGGSALYGSDAVVGVVNLIPRTRFDGIEADVALGFADGYDTRKYSLFVGKQFERGGFTLAYEHSESSLLLFKDRSFAVSDQTSRGGSNFPRVERIYGCGPSVLEAGGSFYPLNATGIGPAFIGAPPVCDLSGNNVILPSQNRESAYATAHFDILDGITWRADGFFHDRSYDFPQSLGQLSYTYTAANNPRGLPLPAGQTRGTVYFNGASLSGGELFHNLGRQRAYGFNSGLEFELPANWKASAFINMSWNRDRSHQDNGVNADAVTSAVNRGLIDPFAPQLLAREQLAPLHNTAFWADGRSRQTELRLAADGPLFELPGGMAKLAVGAAYRRDRQDGLNLINGVVTFLGQPGQPAIAAEPVTFNGRTKNKSAYAEVNLPFVDGKGIPLVDKLVVNLALRHDDYGTSLNGAVPGLANYTNGQGFSTWNPKVGVDWTLTDGVLLRGSYSKSFRAPEAYRLFPAIGRQVALRTATLPDGTRTEAAVITDSPDSIGPEKATTYSLGLELKPAFAPGLQASVTRWWLRVPNAFGAPTRATPLSQAASYPGSIILNPTQAQLDAIMSPPGRYCINLSGLYGEPLPNCFGAGGTFQGPTAGNVFLPGQIGAIIDTRLQNLSLVEARGIDFDLTYSVPEFSGTRVDLGVSGTYFTRYRVSATTAAPASDLLNVIGNPVKLRYRAQAVARKGGLTAFLAYNHTGSYSDLTPLPGQTTPYRIGSFKTVDVALSYRFENAWLDGLELGVNVSNLFDKDPPFANVGGVASTVGQGWDAQQHSAVGRLVTIQLRAAL